MLFGVLHGEHRAEVIVEMKCDEVSAFRMNVILDTLEMRPVGRAGRIRTSHRAFLRHFMTHRAARLRADERHQLALPCNLKRLFMGDKVAGSRPKHTLVHACSLARSHKAHCQCGRKPHKRSVSFPWLHSRSAGREHIELGPTAWPSSRGLNQKKRCTKQNGTVPEAVNAGFLVIALLMMIAPQLTACWGLVALKDRLGDIRSDASPTSNVRYTCRAAAFLCVYPLLGRCSRRSNARWVAPRQPRDAMRSSAV